MTRQEVDRMLRWFSVIGAFLAGAMFGMAMSPAQAQECPIPDPQSFTLAWTAPTECDNGDAIGGTEACPPLDGFYIYVGTVDPVQQTHIDVTDSGLTSYVLGCLAPQTEYHVVMTAYVPGPNGRIESDISNELVFTTAVPVLPNPPTGLRVVEDLTAYSLEKTEGRITLVPIGHVEPGTECDTTQAARDFNGVTAYVVPKASVDFSGGDTEVPFAKCF